MFSLVNTSTMQVLEKRADYKMLADKYDMNKHIILVGEHEFEPRKAYGRVLPAQEVDWDFKKLPLKEAKRLVALAKIGNFIQAKEIINKYHVAHICCAGQFGILESEIKKAQKNGILPF